jgi:DNA ligase (NAD+)
MRVDGEAAWVCPNKWGCAPQIIGRIEHFVGRRMMNIDGIGEETAEALYARGMVRNTADLYDLKVYDLIKLEGFGLRSAERIIDGINESKQVPFDRVVFALSIPYVGETTAKKIARSAGSMDRLMQMNKIELERIEDVGPRIAESIAEYFQVSVNRDNVERLRAAGLQMSIVEDESIPTSEALIGKSIVISGVFSKHSRDEYKLIIERNGGKNVGSISKKTDFVLAGENMGPAKLEKASNLGIPILTEDQFLAMLPNQD